MELRAVHIAARHHRGECDAVIATRESVGVRGRGVAMHEVVPVVRSEAAELWMRAVEHDLVPSHVRPARGGR